MCCHYYLLLNRTRSTEYSIKINKLRIQLALARPIYTILVFLQLYIYIYIYIYGTQRIAKYRCDVTLYHGTRL